MLINKHIIVLGLTVGCVAVAFAAPKHDLQFGSIQQSFADSPGTETVRELVKGGGFGGNPKIGFYSYDGQDGQHPALDFMRDNASGLCYWQNTDVKIKEAADFKYTLVLTSTNTKLAEGEFFLQLGDNGSLIYSVITPENKSVTRQIEKTELRDMFGDRYGQLLQALSSNSLKDLTDFFPEILMITAQKGDTIDFFNPQMAQFKCDLPNKSHENIYWNSLSSDPRNEAKNALLNDALYYATETKKMFQDWFGISLAIDKYGKPIEINIQLNGEESEPDDWDDVHHTLKLRLGDGTYLYSAGSTIIVHELGHAFTYYHSKLGNYVDDHYQAYALDESFADMTSQAVQFYLAEKNEGKGKNDWEIGKEISIHAVAIRYMNNPPQDCGDYRFVPAEIKNICSIDNMNDIDKVKYFYVDGTPSIEEHYLAGVFNKAFYLLSTSPGWDTKKAYSVMVDANRYYWTNTTDFMQAACDVIKVIQEKNTNSDDVDIAKHVFAEVGIDTTTCGYV